MVIARAEKSEFQSNPRCHQLRLPEWMPPLRLRWSPGTGREKKLHEVATTLPAEIFGSVGAALTYSPVTPAKDLKIGNSRGMDALDALVEAAMAVED